MHKKQLSEKQKIQVLIGENRSWAHLRLLGRAVRWWSTLVGTCWVSSRAGAGECGAWGHPYGIYTLLSRTLPSAPSPPQNCPLAPSSPNITSISLLTSLPCHLWVLEAPGMRTTDSWDHRGEERRGEGRRDVCPGEEGRGAYIWLQMNAETASNVKTERELPLYIG